MLRHAVHAGAPALLLAVAAGCSPLSDLTQGVAAWPFLLGAEVDLDELLPLRRAEVFVVVGQVNERYDLARVPVTDAIVTVSGPGFDGVPLALVDDQGLYTTASEEASGLVYVPGERYRVDVEVGGEAYWLEATAAAPLATDLDVDGHLAGEKLDLPLPEGYDDTYAWVLSTARHLDGSTTWSSYPETGDAWVEFAASEYTPSSLKIPGYAVEEAAQTYGVSTIGVVRASTSGDAELSEGLATALSGFTTGSGLVIRVQTAP